MSSSTQTQLVLVTGAANGIGKAIVTELARLKYNIAAWDVDQAGLDNLRTDLLAENPAIKVSVHVVDISDVVRVKEAAAEVEEQIGPIYCLVNNAGVIHRTPCLVKNGSIEDWMKIVNVNVVYIQHLFDRNICTIDRLRNIAKSMLYNNIYVGLMLEYLVNVVGTLNVTSTIFPLMAARKKGHVVNMSSTMGVAGLENQAVYSASKHFIEGLSKSLRKEGLFDGIKVTVVRPSGVATAMTGGLDTESENVDKQSIEVWNELLQSKMRNNLPVMMKSEDLGRAVAYAINLPHEVVINEINLSAIGWPEM